MKLLNAEKIERSKFICSEIQVSAVQLCAKQTTIDGDSVCNSVSTKDETQLLHYTIAVVVE